MKFWWSDNRVERLKTLYAEGLSAGLISVEFGITRNAVVGKIHRLGLSQSDKPKQRMPSVRAIKLKRITHKPRMVEKPRPPPIGRPVTLMELNEFTCRFPLGDPRSPDFRFCGEFPRTGEPYCDHHCRIAYTSPPARKPQTYVNYAKRGAA